MRGTRGGYLFSTVLGTMLAVAAAPKAPAGDWPTHLKNNQRNAVTDEKLELPLAPVWVHHARHAPQPTWPPPAKQDFYHGGSRLEPRVTFDRAYHVTVAGGLLYYGSSADHKVYALDKETGRVRWDFFTEGPVRLAPYVYEEKVYFGSDDGNAYCLNAGDGTLVWKHRAGPEDRRLPGNGHVISLWPVRAGLVIREGIVYAGAGLFPLQGAYLYALDAKTGKEVWKREVGHPVQGYLATDGTRLFVPTGRVGPCVYNLKDGKAVRTGLHGACGTYLVVADGKLLFQQARYRRALGVEGLKFSHAVDFAVARDGLTFLHGKQGIEALRFDEYSAAAVAHHTTSRTIKKLQGVLKRLQKKKDGEEYAKTKAALDRASKQAGELAAKMKSLVAWRHSVQKKQPSITPHSLILAGGLLFAGRDGNVVALGAKDGKEVWRSEVSGKAYGLATAGGKLFVSTDTGKIHCFAPGRKGKPNEIVFETSATPPDDASSAERIVKGLAPKKGYGLIVGAANVGLALGIARRTELKILIRERDGSRAGALRKAIDAAGLHGRVSVHHGREEKLPYPKYFANLIVRTGKRDVPVSGELMRVLRPYGGRIVNGKGEPLGPPRGALPGAGEWTHQYADTSNTASSGDALVKGRMDLLWFGRPGPRNIIDRHNRTMAPLFKEGRVFVPGNERIIALDAYNGTLLWERKAPGSRRVGVLKGAGHMAVAADYVYIAVKEACWGVNAATGAHELTLPVPQLVEGQAREWGYLAVTGDVILGTGQRPRASFHRHKNMCRTLEGDFRAVITSEYLFCLDRRTGKEKWCYRNGAIFNSGITAGGERVFFLESRGEAGAVKNTNGRMRVDTFLKGRAFLVALDTKTGTKLWETPVELPFQHIGYLCYAKDTVLAVGTHNRKGQKKARVNYALRAFHADSGAPKWASDIPTSLKAGGTHGEQWQHPVIIGDRIYSKHYARDLRTGQPLSAWKVKSVGRGCGTLSASASTLFARGRNPYMFDIASQQGIHLNKVSRPGCFINIIPAGGIVSIPESSAGCTCMYPIQTSFAYVPRESPAPQTALKKARNGR